MTTTNIYESTDPKTGLVRRVHPHTGEITTQDPVTGEVWNGYNTRGHNALKASIPPASPNVSTPAPINPASDKWVRSTPQELAEMRAALPIDMRLALSPADDLPPVVAVLSVAGWSDPIFLDATPDGRAGSTNKAGTVIGHAELQGLVSLAQSGKLTPGKFREMLGAKRVSASRGRLNSWATTEKPKSTCLSDLLSKMGAKIVSIDNVNQ